MPAVATGHGAPLVTSVGNSKSLPNELMATFHHRMPVILAPDAEAVWLDPEITDPGMLLSLLVPYPAEVMEAFPVGQGVNAVANDSPQLVLPLDLPGPD